MNCKKRKERKKTVRKKEGSKVRKRMILLCVQEKQGGKKGRLLEHGVWKEQRRDRERECFW